MSEVEIDFIRVTAAAVLVHFLGALLFAGLGLGPVWGMAYKGVSAPKAEVPPNLRSSTSASTSGEPEAATPRQRRNSIKKTSIKKGDSTPKMTARRSSTSGLSVVPPSTPRAVETPQEPQPGHPYKQYLGNLVVCWIGAFVQAHMMFYSFQFYKTTGFTFVANAAFWPWLGFDMTFALFNYIWIHDSFTALGVDALYHFLKQVLVCLVLAVGTKYWP